MTDVEPGDSNAHSAEAAEGRRAHAVDADGKARNLRRLRRIEGQVRGLHKMVEEERYCADVLTQIASVHEALRAVGRELVRNHLSTARPTPSVPEGSLPRPCTTS